MILRAAAFVPLDPLVPGPPADAEALARAEKRLVVLEVRGDELHTLTHRFGLFPGHPAASVTPCSRSSLLPMYPVWTFFFWTFFSLDRLAPKSARGEGSSERNGIRAACVAPRWTRARIRPAEGCHGRIVRPRAPEALPGGRKNAC
jgi:hypothetical protein